MGLNVALALLLAAGCTSLATAKVVIIPHRPNYEFINDADTIPINPVAGQPFSILIRIRNRADTNVVSPATNLTILVYGPSGTGTTLPCGAVGNVTVKIPKIRGGKVYKKLFKDLLTAPLLTAPATRATRSLRMFVDSNCAVNETREDDNQRTVSFVVTAVPTPDLRVRFAWAAGAGPRGVLFNKTFTFKVVVYNGGSLEAKIGTVRAWANRASTPGCAQIADLIILSDTVLKPGKNKTLTLKDLKPPTTLGWATLKVLVDAECATQEISESNQVASHQYRVVSEPLPEFQLINHALIGGLQPSNRIDFVLYFINSGMLPGVINTVSLLQNSKGVQTPLSCASAAAPGAGWVSLPPFTKKLRVGGILKVTFLNVTLPSTEDASYNTLVIPDSGCLTPELSEGFLSQRGSSDTLDAFKISYTVNEGDP